MATRPDHHADVRDHLPIDEAFERVAVAFARSLRSAGLVVPVDATVTFADALSRVGLSSPSATFWAGRAVFVRRPEDIAIYRAVFGAFFGGLAAGMMPAVAVARTAVLDVDDTNGDDDERSHQRDDDRHDDVQAVRFSRHEVLRARDFAEYDANDRADAARLLRALRVDPPQRPSRRRATSPRHRGRPDLRASVARSLRTDGEIIDRRYRRRAQRPRRLVLLLDVSGSMEAYAREFLRFVHIAVIGRRSVEAFALGTRLTRITRDLANRDPDAALAAAAVRVVDWSGGTRLGDTLAAFNAEWGVRGIARGATVVVLSDGWDRGNPERLACEMERLHRVAHRVVWVNPLKASPGYVPLAQGMAAALPFIDEFVEGHSVAALERVVTAIARDDKGTARA